MKFDHSGFEVLKQLKAVTSMKSKLQKKNSHDLHFSCCISYIFRHLGQRLTLSK